MRTSLTLLALASMTVTSTFTMGCEPDCESTCERAREEGCGHMWSIREVLTEESTPVSEGCAGSTTSTLPSKVAGAAGCPERLSDRPLPLARP